MEFKIHTFWGDLDYTNDLDYTKKKKRKKKMAFPSHSTKEWLHTDNWGRPCLEVIAMEWIYQVNTIYNCTVNGWKAGCGGFWNGVETIYRGATSTIDWIRHKKKFLHRFEKIKSAFPLFAMTRLWNRNSMWQDIDYTDGVVILSQIQVDEDCFCPSSSADNIVHSCNIEIKRFTLYPSQVAIPFLRYFSFSIYTLPSSTK